MRALMTTTIGLLFLCGLGIACAQTYDFKSIVLGGKSSIDALGERGLTCDVARRTENGVKCVGNDTMLGQEGALTVYIDNGDVIRGIIFQYRPKDAVKNMKLLPDMERSLIEKFGRPIRQAVHSLTWENAQGQVVVFSGGPRRTFLEMRGGVRKQAPKLDQDQKKDL